MNSSNGIPLLRKPLLVLPAFILIFVSLFLPLITFGQTKGLIVKPAAVGTGAFAGQGKAILDPDLDGYVSVKTNSVQRGFQANDLLESEIPYRPLPVPAAEPMNDLARGPGGGFSDFADMNSTVYPVSSYLSPANNLMFRFRLGGIAPNSKGYSILVDSDGKFGFSGSNADPEASVDNPGFEFEILLATNFAVRLYDINNNTGTATQKGTDADLPYSIFAQKAIAYTTNSGDADYFYDFYIPFSKITQYFPTVTTSTTLRMVANTIMAPQSVIKGPISDISGIDDKAYSTSSTAWTKIINGFVPTPAAGTTTSNFPAVRSDAPVVSSPIYKAATTVSGTSSEASGTLITVYKAGASIGTTTVASNGTWRFTVPGGTTLNANDRITATATASGESVSDLSNEVIVIVNCTYSRTPELACASDKGFSGRVVGVAANTVINLYRIGDPNTIVMTILTGTNGMAADEFKYLCSGTYNNNSYTNCNPGGGCVGTSLGDGSYYARAIETVNGVTLCESPRSASQCVGYKNTSALPVITTTKLTPSSTSISGTGISGSRIVALADNSYIGAIDIPATPTGTAISWTISNITVRAGQVVQVQQIESGKCASDFTTPGITVTDPSTPPVVNSPIRAGATTISGTSTEPAGTVINVSYTRATTTTQLSGSATVAANGTWSFTVTGVTLATNDAITATATAANKTVSSASNSVTVTAVPGAVPAVPAITGTYKEGDTSVSGTGPASTTINVYIDGYLIGTVTSAANGAWSLTGLNASNYDLYAGGVLTATSGTIGSNESAKSAGVTVACIPPTVLTATRTYDQVCTGSNAEFRIAGSQSGVIYTLMNGSVERGPSVLGTGDAAPAYAPVISFPLTNTTSSPATETFTIVAKSIYGGTCSAPNMTMSPNGNVIVNPAPLTDRTVTAPATVLLNTTADIVVKSPQAGFIYQLRKGLKSIGSSKTSATGADLNFTTDKIAQDTVYYFQVTDPTRSTNCTTKLTQTAYIRVSNTPLPVELISFAGKFEKEGVLLEWATATEKNNANFEVERSADGRNFETIGKVKGHLNSSSLQKYAFTDRQLVVGLVYYRLKQVDLDGTFDYSNIIVLDRKHAGNQEQMVLYPNPASSNCAAVFNSAHDQKVAVVIYDALGNIVRKQEPVAVKAGQATINIQTRELSAGIYFIRISGETMQANLKLRKLND